MTDSCAYLGTGSSFLLALTLVLCTACTSLAPSSPDRDPVQLPRSFSLETQGIAGWENWWEAWDDPQLDALMSKALDNNPDIAAAYARLRRARALADQAGADRIPALTLEGESSASRTYTDNSFKTETRSSSLGLQAGYELDLWGRISSRAEAAALDLKAAREDLQVARISIAAETAETWIRLLALRREKQVLKEQIDVNSRLLDSLILRLEKGVATAAEVTRQKQALEAVRSALPALSTQERLTLNSLALLTGQADPELINISGQNLPANLPRPDAGLPSHLLMSRPDIKSAYLSLQSAGRDTARARAERLPQVNITARSLLSSPRLTPSWGDWLVRLGLNLAAPLVDGGLRLARVEQALAEEDQQTAEYAALVLGAVREVQDALAREQGQEKTIQGIEREMQAALEAADQARLRYLLGQGQYTDYLGRLESLQNLEQKLIQARADLLSHRVSLYRALGTGWKTAELQAKE
ncbi:MAG: efflux transporter outer membrane subunit [Desulfonatronovibrionaceae bacterium]